MQVGVNNGYSAKQMPWLDLVRFIAAFIVLIGHFRAQSFVEYGLLPVEDKTVLTQIFYLLTRMGGEAVLIFFVLSGYFIVGRGIEKCQQGQFDLRKYTVDRFVRIMLPLISALLLLVVVNYVCGINFSWVTILGNLFSLQGVICGPAVGPLWSLSYEVWFYILFGASAYLIATCSKSVEDKSGHVTVCGGGVICCATMVLLSFIVFTKLSPHYLFIWCMGGFAYLIRPKKRSRMMLILSSIGIALSVLLMEFAKESRSLECTISVRMEVIEIVLAMFCCLFIRQICMFPPRHKIAVKLNKAGSHLAKFSYTLYLTHMVVLRLFIYIGMPQSASLDVQAFGLYIAELALALVAAYIIYWLFERRTYKVKRFILALKY